jgi:hypothetical protein
LHDSSLCAVAGATAPALGEAKGMRVGRVIELAESLSQAKSRREQRRRLRGPLRPRSEPYAWLDDIVCTGYGYLVDGGVACRVHQILQRPTRSAADLARRIARHGIRA